MDPERFRRIDELYHSVLQHSEHERPGFLQEACAGDEDLRREVESLLAYESKAIEFMEIPAVAQAAPVLARTLSHYRIIEELGSGGMGVVYRARDERLGRDVALKVLPPRSLQNAQSRQRLRKEARALSKVSHPNVAVIYDFDTQDGIDFIVMELIPGITLNEKIAEGCLPEKEVVQLGIQMAEGLAAAHDQGVIHRDLKPGNLRLANDGRLKILDFGLAKSLRSEDASEALTETNALQGTLPYMAPEQLLCGNADERSDIYASGAVLYEMASGRRPFSEGHKPHLIHAIVHDRPGHPDLLNKRVSPGLDRIILKCLEKEPQNRYQSALALAADLRRLSETSVTVPAVTQRRIASWAIGFIAVLCILIVIIATNVAGIRDLFIRHGPISSLAVLPLDNLSGDPEQDYFADGITDALITNLAKINALRVVSRTSIMRYKRTQKSLPEIAKELNVDAIVEGAVNRAGDRVRITAQLVRANDQHLWAEAYERDMHDVLVLQDDVARSIAQQIQVTVTPAEHERLTHARSIDPETYELYLKGRYFWATRTEASIEKAIEMFRQAIERDSTYAAAYSGLADCYSLFGLTFDVGGVAPTEIQPKALAAATKAAELDDSSAEAHSSLAFIKLNYDWEWAQSERDFKRSIELNPGWANAHHWYAHHLMSSGRVREAEAESRRALELDPFSGIMNTHLGWHYYFARQYDKSLEQLRTTLELVPDYGLAFWYTGWAHEQKGLYAEALRDMQRAKALLKTNISVDADIGHLYAVSGNKTGAVRVLRDLKELSTQRYVNSFEIALIYVGLGDKDRAFEWLEQAYRERSDMLVYLKVDPRLDPIRSEARFEQLVRKVGVP